MGTTLCYGFLVVFACQAQEAPQIDAARYCKTAKPISWSAKDTAETKLQVKRENAKWKALCQPAGQ